MVLRHFSIIGNLSRNTSGKLKVIKVIYPILMSGCIYYDNISDVDREAATGGVL